MKLVLNYKVKSAWRLALLLLFFGASPAAAEEYLSGIRWEKPKVLTPGATSADAPSDAVILFDGTDLSQWNNADQWRIEEGAMVSGRGDIFSKETFGDCQLHLEWSAPTEIRGSGQGRGNSGIFFMNTYEIQVLDSFENETYPDGQAGAIYKQTPPLANAMRPPGQWNVYDIVWTAPRFNEDGSLKSPAYITAIHNGILILNHFQLEGDTPYHRPPEYKQHADAGPIRLQDHGNPVRFRNIWVRRLQPIQGERERGPFIRRGAQEIPVQDK
ncbi:MAG: DUF1080 domain-containing protein [Pirellulaceae bacterium]|nr:DUF1080 domain-containing protein [Pirellulaceae bacterium]